MMVLLVMGNDRGTVEHRGRALHPRGGAGAGHDRWGPAGDQDGDSRVAVERGTQGLPGQVEAWGGTRYRTRDSESGE